jgi:hypothetical protein
MTPSRVPDLVAGRTHPRAFAGNRCRVRLGPARVASVVLAVCALTLALGVTTAHALFLPLSSFGSPGSGAGQFQTPVGVAVDDLGSPGGVYVADSGHARVQKFDVTGNFVAAWGWGVSDGLAQSEVCTSTCQAGIAGSGAGQFSHPTSIGVDNSGGPSSGDVYVGDTGNNVVLKFDSNGTYLATIDGSGSTQGQFQSVVGVAVDQSGNLWVADDGTDNVVEFDAGGNFLQQWNDTYGQTVTIAVDSTNNAVYLIRGTLATERWTLTGGNETVIDNGNGAALAVDQQTGTLYVDHGGDIVVYDSTGAQVDSFTLTGSSSQGLAFGSSTGHLYVSDASADNVTIYGPPTTPGVPFIQSESFTDVTETSATLHATIVPFGLDTTCTFQYVDDAGFQANGYTGATSVPCVPFDLGSSFTFVQASADLSGLTSGTTYHFRVVATNSAGTTNGADKTFHTVGAPVVVSESASNLTDTTATLNATVSPSGLDTTCQFQYVDQAGFQASGYNMATSVDCSPFDLGSSFDPQTTSASVTGLTPGTTYHFRVVATNADGTTTGADTTFQTLVSFLIQVGQFGSPGTGSGQFQTPIGVAVYQRGGQVYVADSANARIEKFDKKGKFIAAWGWGVTDGAAMSEVCKSKTKCQAGIAGAGPGQFTTPTSVAVNSSSGPSRGNVYVGDAGTNVVLKFSSAGKYLATIDGSSSAQGHFVSLAGVAVDQNGNLWTADAGTGNVGQFNNAGTFLGEWNDPSGSPSAIAVDATRGAVYLITFGTTERFTFTGGGRTTIDSGSGTALGLDPQTGNLYVDHGGDVAVYDPTGARIDTLFSLGAATSSQGLAYRATGQGSSAGRNDRLYVSDRNNDNVTIYGPHSAGAPFITAESASAAGKTTETLKATIVPLGHKTTCTFQYVGSADFQANGYTNATTVPCTPASLGSSFTYQQASATVPGLTVGAFYHFRVVATNSAGTTTGADQTFQAGPGAWTPFSRCPVDDPAMLATDGVNTVSFCLASNSPHGSITIGATTTATGNSNLQVGLVADVNNFTFTVVGPAGGALVGDPVQVTAGGITVTATVESAGVPTNFDLLAGISVGMPIITLPIKIHLESLPGAAVDLGPSCFIGSDMDPIILMPANTDVSNAMLNVVQFDPDGTPDPNGILASLVVSGTTQGDDTFAVPGASGCGPNGDGSLDSVVNAVVGLPSPSGANHVVLDDASSALAFPTSGLSGSGTIVTGQQFSDDWHLAFD